ncbi:aldehyde dehydrogenase (NADP(+)) [Castellaniella sp.]|uniref:aldehyde dehydrogenase (NADP(+)) n=1 Tax=Castellaniella sp. TaxID=1955812 RepID=UPI002AFE46FC|nr:aldehyde dehydrogenase (NADP(+)) [Castellaniella sp.]
MQVTGDLLIGGQAVQGAGVPAHSMNPATGQALAPEWRGADAAQVDQAVRLAQEAFLVYRNISLTERAAFLEKAADRVEGLGDALINRAMQETGLPQARLRGELGRTVNQLRLFADVVRRGDWLGVRIERALPDRKPMPRSDIRLRRIPVGPVTVFGASNFPLAFSVAGGDTASALASGCPVLVKAHSAHLGTSELVGRAIVAAVQECGLPPGVFALLTGPGSEIGMQLVRHPLVKAVAFTGSRQGGMALVRVAAARPEPIPVFAEMSSVNPVFLLPGALQARAEQTAQGFVTSLTGSAGQLCTNPGLVIGVRGPDFQRFIDAVVEQVCASAPGTMLTAGIHRAYQAGVQALQDHAQVCILARGRDVQGVNQCQASVALTSAAAFLADPDGLGAEVFGASTLLIECDGLDDMIAIARALEGQLTATLHGQTADDNVWMKALLPELELKAGRILANGFPTGVEVCHAMVHGGPFPATSDARSTSVGTMAIDRFLRPVCYQDVPQGVLPGALQDGNPWGVMQREF